MMVLTVYLISAFILLAAAFVIFRILVRREYQRQHRLTRFTSFLELLIWVLFVFFPCIYNPSDWLWPWFADTPVSPVLRIIGLVSITLGIAVAVVAMVALGMRTTFGRKAEMLEQTGLYRVSRNPQLVGGGLMVIGCVVLWLSWYALGWVMLYGIIGHIMVLTEEEHLRDVYGEEYVRYCERVPRYLGIPQGS